MNGTELRSFSHFQILTWIGYTDLSRNHENWLILMFAFIPYETVKVSQDDQIRIETYIYSKFKKINFKILKSFRNFLVKSTSECNFWLADKVSTDCNEYFLKFSWKMFRISFRPKKLLLGPYLIQTLKYWKVFKIFLSKVHQNAISDLQKKFQVILTRTFWNFHEKCLESVLGRKSHF